MWCCPVPYQLVPTADSDSYTFFEGTRYTGLPRGQHVGAFGVQRKHHIHEGVDLYVPISTPVMAVEPGEVVAVIPFTGKHAGSPWWHNTYAVLVEGETGVVVYGEIAPHVHVGQQVVERELIGVVLRVLMKDKSRPTSMLHLELHTHGARACPEWTSVRPGSLLDPTPHLLSCRYS